MPGSTNLALLVDPERIDHPAVQALREKYEVGALGSGDYWILSQRASYFDPAWWDDSKLVEAALKRARSEKRRRTK